jgi:hypothetical protein
MGEALPERGRAALRRATERVAKGYKQADVSAQMGELAKADAPLKRSVAQRGTELLRIQKQGR